MLSDERMGQIRRQLAEPYPTVGLDIVKDLLADRAEREAELGRLKAELADRKRIHHDSVEALTESRAAALAELARLRAAVAGLEDACREAREDVEEWAEDLGDERQRVTLKQLWGLSKRLDAALATARTGTTTTGTERGGR
jgi:DNA repair ATPase RecN